MGPAVEPNGDDVERFVRGLEGDYFTQREVARALNCSTGLLAKLREEDHERHGPSFCVDFRSKTILLYTEEDVQRIRAHLAIRSPHLAVDASPDSPGAPGKSLNRMGRPALFTPAETLERQNRHSKAGYWKAQAVKYTARRDYDKAKVAQRRADIIRDQLRAEHVARAADRDAEESASVPLDLVVG